MGKFNATLDIFCSRPIRKLVDSTREIPTSGPLGMVVGGVRENPDVIPSKLSLSIREIYIPNSISIASASIAGLTVVTDRQTDQQTDHATPSVAIGRV